jgi:hypothetical protein
MEQMNLLQEYHDYKEMSFEKVPVYEGTGEDKKLVKKDLYITGPFLQGNKLNKNGRVYPTDMLGESIKSFYDKKMKRGIGAPGELNHPQGVDINLERVSHYITELTMDGDNGMGKAKIATTPCGSIARCLLEDGMTLGVSTRGLGNVEERNGQKMVSGFDLVTVDIVSDPSAPDAFVESIMEGLRYYKNNETNEVKLITTIEEILENVRHGLTVLPTKTEERKIKMFDVVNAALNKL